LLYLRGIGTLSPELIFPFRRETLAALEWANLHVKHWKLQYYHALNLWGKDRKAEAALLLQAIGSSSDYAPFYLTRAALLKEYQEKDPLVDLKKAKQLNGSDWRIAQAMILYYLEHNEIATAVSVAQKSYQQFPNNYAIGMDYVKALNLAENYATSIEILDQLKVLPFEGAVAGRKLYENAHLKAALQQMKQKDFQKAKVLLEKVKEWPENLGVGKPYDTDERPANYLLAHCYQQLGDTKMAQQYLQQVADYSEAHIGKLHPYHLLGLKAKAILQGKASALQLLNNLQVVYKGQQTMDWITANYLGKGQLRASDHPVENALDLKFIQEVFRYN